MQLCRLIAVRFSEDYDQRIKHHNHYQCYLHYEKEAPVFTYFSNADYDCGNEPGKDAD